MERSPWHISPLSVPNLLTNRYVSFQNRETELKEAIDNLDKNGGGADEALNRVALDRASAAVAEEKTSAEAKLTSLNKYWSRLDEVADKLSTARRELRTAPAIEASSLLADREPEIKEVLGNFANLEKECQVVGQTVSPHLKVRICSFRAWPTRYFSSMSLECFLNLSWS